MITLRVKSKNTFGKSTLAVALGRYVTIRNGLKNIPHTLPKVAWKMAAASSPCAWFVRMMTALIDMGKQEAMANPSANGCSIMPADASARLTPKTIKETTPKLKPSTKALKKNLPTTTLNNSLVFKPRPERKKIKPVAIHEAVICGAKYSAPRGGYALAIPIPHKMLIGKSYAK